MTTTVSVTFKNADDAKHFASTIESSIAKGERLSGCLAGILLDAAPKAIRVKLLKKRVKKVSKKEDYSDLYTPEINNLLNNPKFTGADVRRDSREAFE